MNEGNGGMERYLRHYSLPGVGREGQGKLLSARILIVGAGGLGSPAALYLAAAGVGTIGIADPDTVELTNLQRQVLHDTPHEGKPKVDSAGERIAALNPGVRFVPHRTRLDARNAREIIRDYDVVLDGTDRTGTRYMLNDACFFEHKPLVHGAVLRFAGQASVFVPGGPCYRCAFPGPAAPTVTCAEAGVLGVLPGLIGMIQATEALKLVLGLGKPLSGRLLLVDAAAMTFRELSLERDPACNLCGDNPSIKGMDGDYDSPDCGQKEDGMLGLFGGKKSEVTADELRGLLSSGKAPVLVDVREKDEWTAGHLPGAKWIPLGQLAGRLKELDSSADTVVYCLSGGRSGTAAGIMSSAGFKSVRNLARGLSGWGREGLVKGG